MWRAADRAVREEEARIKREEAEIKGKIVISLCLGANSEGNSVLRTVLNDETEELMAKAAKQLRSCHFQFIFKSFLFSFFLLKETF